MAIEFRQLRLRIRALTAGLVDDALLESAARTKIEETWAAWDWSFKEATSVLATVGPHSEGTVSLGTPATLVEGLGTAFTAADVGREFVVGNQNARYTIAAVDVGTQQVTLATPYIGDSFTASAYKIQQSVYPLPADFGEAFEPVWWHRIVETSLPQMDRYDGRRAFTSNYPISFRYAGISATGVQLVELSPVPASAMGIHFIYKRKPPNWTDTDLVPLPEYMLAYLVASDALAVKAMETAEKQPAAAQLYLVQSDKYQALGLKAQQEAQFQDLQISSPARAVRDEAGTWLYSDDYGISHDWGSPI